MSEKERERARARARARTRARTRATQQRCVIRLVCSPHNDKYMLSLASNLAYAFACSFTRFILSLLSGHSFLVSISLCHSSFKLPLSFSFAPTHTPHTFACSTGAQSSEMTAWHCITQKREIRLELWSTKDDIVTLHRTKNARLD